MTNRDAVAFMLGAGVMALFVLIAQLGSMGVIR